MRSRMIRVFRGLVFGLSCWLCSTAHVEAALPSYLAAAEANPSAATTGIFDDAASDRAWLDQGSSSGNTSHGDRATPANEKSSNTLLEGCDENICCSLPTCTMCPCTYGWVEGLILRRNNQSFNQPLVLNLNTGEPLLSTGDLGFKTAAGMRAGFGYRTCAGRAWEFNYLGLFHQSASAFVALHDELALPGDLGLAVNNFFFADTVSVGYTSRLNSAEINRVCCRCSCADPACCRSLEWLYGFRYLNLNESLSIVSTDFEESSTTYRVRANNNLFGAQVGSRFRRCFGQWSWEGTVKAGIFGNAAEQIGDPIVDFPDFLIRPRLSTSAVNVAFVGDLNFSGVYQLSNVWGIRAGYNLMWIEGVALAPNQLDFTNTPTSGTQLSTNGGVFLHGVNIGLEARW